MGGGGILFPPLQFGIDTLISLLNSPGHLRLDTTFKCDLTRSSGIFNEEINSMSKTAT